MKSKSLKCNFCSSVVPSETCELAAYSTVIDGKEYTFCCKTCAEDYDPKKSK